MWSLLDRRHAQPEQPGLAEVVVERGRQLAHLATGGHGLRHVEEGALGVAGDERAATVERVGSVGGDTSVDGGLVHAVAKHVVDRCVRPVDRQLVEVRAAQPGQLGVDVGEQPHLEQRVVGDVDAGHEVADVEGHLLRLGEEVRRRAGEGEQPERLHRGELLRHQLGGVEQVDALEGLVGGVLEGLDAELPLRVGAALDRVVQVAPVEVGVHAPEQLCLLPGQRVHAEPRLPVELDQGGVALGGHETERVHPEALHVPVRPWGSRGPTSPRSCGAAPRCAVRRSPRRCRAPTGPGGSRGRGAVSPRG